MRLFFFHSSRAKKGFRREINPKALDFYSKRSDHSTENQRILTNSVFWFSLYFVLQVGMGSLFIFRSRGTLDMDVERLSTGITIPGAINVTKIEEKRILLNVVINKDGEIRIAGFDRSDDEISDFVFERLIEEPKLIVMIYADQDIEMERIYTLTRELREATAYRVVFAAAPNVK